MPDAWDLSKCGDEPSKLRFFPRNIVDINFNFGKTVQGSSRKTAGFGTSLCRRVGLRSADEVFNLIPNAKPIGCVEFGRLDTDLNTGVNLSHGKTNADPAASKGVSLPVEVQGYKFVGVDF